MVTKACSYIQIFSNLSLDPFLLFLMARLVESILKAQGYITTKSEQGKGPDNVTTQFAIGRLLNIKASGCVLTTTKSFVNHCHFKYRIGFMMVALVVLLDNISVNNQQNRKEISFSNNFRYNDIHICNFYNYIAI